MTEKMKLFAIVGIGIVAAELLLAFMFPAIHSLSSEAATTLNATSNMTNYPGTLEAVQSSDVWIWFIPPIVGIVVIVFVAIKDRF